MQQVYDFLKKCGVYYLATAEGGQPRVRPFGIVEIFEGRLYMQTGSAKDVSRQMRINPNVEICACAGGEWLRVTATAVPDERAEAKQYILDAHPALKEKFGANYDNTDMYYLKDAIAVFCTFSEKKRVVRF